MKTISLNKLERVVKIVKPLIKTDNTFSGTPQEKQRIKDETDKTFKELWEKGFSLNMIEAMANRIKRQVDKA